MPGFLISFSMLWAGPASVQVTQKDAWIIQDAFLSMNIDLELITEILFKH
jgi:hypothetical protein